jgi:autotransporter translocation and assembly factor TamB
VAKDFDVAWLARFNEKVESLGGKVTADAKVAGTVGDPQFIGDVRWKNGKVISIDPRKAPRR